MWCLQLFCWTRPSRRLSTGSRIPAGMKMSSADVGYANITVYFTLHRQHAKLLTVSHCSFKILYFAFLPLFIAIAPQRPRRQGQVLDDDFVSSTSLMSKTVLENPISAGSGQCFSGIQRYQRAAIFCEHWGDWGQTRGSKRRKSQRLYFMFLYFRFFFEGRCN